MASIHVKRSGLAFGIGFSALFLGCVLIMFLVPQKAALFFFNSISHGVDWGAILRVDIPWWEVFVGLIEVFAIGWLFGVLIAFVYNLGAKKQG